GRLAALNGRQRLRDRVLISARVDRLDLDARVLFLEVGRESVDDLGDGAADRDGVVKRDFDRRLRPCAMRENGRCGRGRKRCDDTPGDFLQHGFSPPRIESTKVTAKTGNYASIVAVSTSVASVRRDPPRSKKCCAPRAQVSRVASPTRSPTLP